LKIGGVSDARRTGCTRCVTHLYGLTEDEFRHILGTFPLVDESVKVAALAAYKAQG
jgi:hypothetical protein